MGRQALRYIKKKVLQRCAFESLMFSIAMAPFATLVCNYLIGIKLINQFLRSLIYAECANVIIQSEAELKSIFKYMKNITVSKEAA